MTTIELPGVPCRLRIAIAVGCLPARALKAVTRYRLGIDSTDFVDAFGRALPGAFEMTFATSHRRSQLHVERGVAVLEQTVDTHIPVVVTDLDSIELKYQTWSARGAGPEVETALKVDPAPDIAYHFPIEIRELIPGGVGATVKLSRGFENFTLQFVADAPTLASAATDENGLATLPGTIGVDGALEMLGYGETSMLIHVAKGSDMALLPTNYAFRAPAAEGNGAWIATDLKARHGHIHTWGFTPQGVYRAGDLIQYKIYVRDQDNLRFVATPNKGYRLAVYDPRGTVVHEESFDLSEFGAHDGEFRAPEQSAVGWYRFALRSETIDDVWEPLTVLVSDFTPAPFRVTTRPAAAWSTTSPPTRMSAPTSAPTPPSPSTGCAPAATAWR
ncbi:MAG: hypothetical protein JXR83_21770 [Deltaproteobacteria bacterium]|nr:hypothetical protein [Deltaproteobacteria bacterium]